MTSPLQQQQTSSKYLGVLYQNRPPKKQARTSHPETHCNHDWSMNGGTNSGCTNSKGGCTMSEDGNYSTTKGGNNI
jgi:hypothetical protein